MIAQRFAPQTLVAMSWLSYPGAGGPSPSI